jgi:nitroreductase/dihydropteridine reductase
MSLIETLKWRYATKRMNGTKVSQQKIDKVLEAIHLTPTSYGLQAFKAIVIENADLKEQVFNEACQQPQIKESSHLIVFAATKNVDAKQADDHIQLIAQTRGIPADSLNGYRSMLELMVAKNEESNFIWTSKQTYIALGIALVAAGEEKIDATPIEGFNPQALDQILKLTEQNLGSVTILALGYRDESNDKMAVAKKVRKPKDVLIDFLR